MVTPDPIEQAKAARVHSRAHFLSAVDQGREARILAENVQEHARRNHWGEGLERAMTSWRARS